MHRLQEVVWLHRLGRSARAIARQLCMGRNTIQTYVAALAKAGVLDGDAEDLQELATLRTIVGEHVPSKTSAQQTSTALS